MQSSILITMQKFKKLPIPFKIGCQLAISLVYCVSVVRVQPRTFRSITDLLLARSSASFISPAVPLRSSTRERSTKVQSKNKHTYLRVEISFVCTTVSPFVQVSSDEEAERRLLYYVDSSRG